MFQFLTIAALTLSLATIVKGHGFVHEVVVNGKSYPGYAPFTDPYASPAVQRIVRKVPDDGPGTYSYLNFRNANRFLIKDDHTS